MEITKDKVTELFCIIDEFYKVFDAEILDSCIVLFSPQLIERKHSCSNTTIQYFSIKNFVKFINNTK